MNLQFAFGNPRKGKKAKSRKSRPKKGSKRVKTKKVAKRRKKLKTKSVKPNFSKVVQVAKSKRRAKRRKNPAVAVIRKNGRIIGREYSPYNAKEAVVAESKLKKAMSKYKAIPSNKMAVKSAALKELIAVKKSVGPKLVKRASFLKTVERYTEDQENKIKSFDTAEKGASVAKKKRKSKKSKSTKSRAKKKAVKAAAPKKARKVRRKKARKSGKRRSKRAKKVTAVKVKRASKRKGGKRRKHSKKRRRARMITHSHSSAQRHIKKGTSFRFKTKAKRGKRSITVSGRVKVNPFRRNPMKNLSAQSKKYLGLDAAELGSLALGGALVPIVNAGISKIPGADKAVAFINSYAGPQATGSLIPILVGAALNFAGDKAGGSSKQYLKMAGEGLAAAGVVGLVMGLSQKYVAPALGLSGINYTPSMRGINYTPSMGIMPQMNGINYTPSMQGMGIMPTLNGVDFGSANYGGDGGSREARTQNSDFGAWDSADSEAEGLMDEDNSYSSSMN